MAEQVREVGPGQEFGPGRNAGHEHRDVRGEMRAIAARVDAGDTEPAPGDVGPFLPTGQAGNLRWIVVLVVAVVGLVGFAVGSHDGLRAGLSYLGGLAVSVAAFEFGAFNIRVVDRLAPELTLAAALFSYTVTAVGFGLILFASSPRVVDGQAIAIGLGTGLTVWLSALVVASRVRLEHP